MTTWTTTTAWPTDLLRIGDLTCISLGELLDLAARIKAEPVGWIEALPGRSLAALFEKPSAGIRVAVEMAAHRLGMLPILLRPDELELDRREPICETARALSHYATALFAGGFAHDTLRQIARAATVPVINAFSDDHDPCQAMADLLTLRECFGRLEGLALAYVGDAGNVAHSLMEAGALAAMDIRIACPPDCRPALEVQTGAEVLAELHGGTVTVTEDPRAAVAGADAVYTRAWVSRGQEAERDGRLARLRAYQVDADLMSLAKPTAVFMHCLPAHRGEEVTAGVIDGPRSVVRQQAANRLPTQQAAIYALATCVESAAGRISSRISALNHERVTEAGRAVAARLKE